MSYFSKFYQVDVRESIAKEFTNSSGEVDDIWLDFTRLG